MRPRHRVSSAGLDLVKRFEGYRRQAAQLPDGRWTIGYGHTLTAREGAQVSETDAEALLQYDLHAAGKAIDDLVFTPLNQNQFDALCSFVFNLGVEEFRGSETLRRVNEGAMVQAACAMELWRKAEFEGEEILVDALVRRRAAEKILFLTPPGDAFVPAPSPVLRPRVDPGLYDLLPADSPTQLAASLYGPLVVVTRGEAPPPPPPEPEPAPTEASEPEAQVEPEPDFEAEFEIPPVSEPQYDRVTAAAEAVTARLETLFSDASEPESESELEPDAGAAVEAEAVIEAEASVEPQAEPVAERDQDEQAFIHSFIEAAPEADAPERPAAEPEIPEPAPPQITPIVMAPLATGAASQRFGAPFPGVPFSPSAPLEQPRSEPDTAADDLEGYAPQPGAEPEPEREPLAEPDAADLVAEPIDDEDEPPLSFEPPEADLWGDDDPYSAPQPLMEPEAEIIADEPPPAAEPPPRAIDEDELDAFVRRPQVSPPQTEPVRDRPPFVAGNAAVRDFLPHRPTRPERQREPGLLTDLFLALLGVAFFGFAVFWALNAKVDPTGPGVHPSLIAWPTGFIGIGFVVVAIFRLLERLGDAAERD